MVNRPTKIAIVCSSLGIGGAERSSALLSVLLSNLGYDVHIIIVLDHIDYEYSGTLLNLGKFKNTDDSKWGRFKRMLILRNYLKKHNFYRIIDNRTRQSTLSEWIISRYIYDPRRAIYVVRSFHTDYYFPNNELVARSIYRHSPFIVAVSNLIQQKVIEKYGYANVKRIYNPVPAVANGDAIALPHQIILAYGRIDDEVKNYSLLINSYSKSALAAANVKLYIIGNGKDAIQLSDQAKAMNLANEVVFLPHQSNPFPYVKAALFTVLTSRFEGFPRTLIESLSLGTPVVSVDCESGPREIVQNRINGLLVENNNISALANAFDEMITNELLYQTCKANAVASIAHLSTDTIAAQWHKLLAE